MAHSIPHPFTGEATHFTKEQWTVQGELFSPLPRHLPIFKTGPEDETDIFQRLANRGAIYPTQH